MYNRPYQPQISEYPDDYPFPNIPQARGRNRNEIEDWQDKTEEGLFNLLSSEQWWVAHFQSLLSRGYLLRKRFRPGWRPSWLGTDRNPFYCEDSIKHNHLSVMDAKRLQDGSTIAIKRLRPNSEEARITLMFSAPGRRADPMNHCIPVLDRFTDQLNQIDYIVIPLLRTFDSPPFSSVGEVLDFVRQTLHGLAYMHHQGVAHRNLTPPNVMMDGNAVYPEGFHPSRQDSSPRAIRDAARFSRRSESAVPVRYFFVNFSLSICFRDPSAPRLVRGSEGLDRSVPEFGTSLPYDPFAIDIYMLGNVYRKTFLEEYSNLTFLEPLIAAMTKLRPSDRPTAYAALEYFEQVASRQSALTHVWRLRGTNEYPGEGII